MIHRTGNSKTMAVAMLTVRIEADLTERLLQPTVHMPWTVTHQDFSEYLSALRRPQFPPEVRNASRVVAVIDFDTDPEQALDTASYLNQLFLGRIAIIALSTRTDADLLLRAMRTGCTEFLKKPFDPAQFSVALNRLEQQWSGTMDPSRNDGQVISFFGAKGGVGTTTIAVHLAMFLVRNHHKKVLLIDGHAQLGHVCLYLGMDGKRYHFQQLIQNVGRLDSDFLRGFIATHSSGLDVLSSPDSYDAQIAIDPDALERTIEFLRGEYDFVLLDCDTTLAETDLAIMDRSDQIYLIATPEIGAIRDLSRYIDGLVRNEHTTAKLHTIINRYSSRDAVGIVEIDKAIRLPVEIRIPNSYFECVRAVNAGEPVSSDRKSDFTLQFTMWAKTLVDPAGTRQADPPKKRFALWHWRDVENAR
jgi:pilus assembly protein CpaE